MSVPAVSPAAGEIVGDRAAPGDRVVQVPAEWSVAHIPGYTPATGTIVSTWTSRGGVPMAEVTWDRQGTGRAAAADLVFMETPRR